MLDMLKVFSNESKMSKNIAKERLKLVLVHDRANCSSEFLGNIKGEIINVISNYIEVDEENLEVKVTKTRNKGKIVSALVANIPIKNVKNSK